MLSKNNLKVNILCNLIGSGLIVIRRQSKYMFGISYHLNYLLESLIELAPPSISV